MTSARGRGISLSENNDSVMSISWFDMFSFAASVLTTVTAAFEVLDYLQNGVGHAVDVGQEALGDDGYAHGPQCLRAWRRAGGAHTKSG